MEKENAAITYQDLATLDPDVASYRKLLADAD